MFLKKVRHYARHTLAAFKSECTPKNNGLPLVWSEYQISKNKIGTDETDLTGSLSLMQQSNG